MCASRGLVSWCIAATSLRAWFDRFAGVQQQIEKLSTER